MSDKTEVSQPALEDLQSINTKNNLGCTDDALQELMSVMKKNIDDLNFIESLEVTEHYVKCERDFRYPNPDENTNNAWYVTCNIQYKKEGKLANKKVAIKDNTAVAFLPMMIGSSVMEGYTPDYDATIVRRILEEGGIIVGKTTCEDLCLSGGSFLTKYGSVTNPYNKDYSAGGSSSGSGVVVALGEADMAIGGDQGGSVRIPASYCGIVGLKPTHGLVPYTGAVPIIPCLDHLGPMTKNVADCALLLEVIAGYDRGFDYRQKTEQMNQIQYSKLIYPHVKPIRKLKIGVLKEAVDLCSQEVINVFQNALNWLTGHELLETSEVSYQKHTISEKVCFPIGSVGAYDCMIKGDGFGTGVSGFQSHSLASKLFEGYKTHADELSISGKFVWLLSEYIKDKYGLYHYAKASSLLAEMKLEYDAVLDKFDVLVMPTLPNLPCRIPSPDASIKEKLEKADDMLSNMAIFDVTGHPALTINCGYHNEFPVGLMIVGKHFDDLKVLSAGRILESTFEKYLKK